MPGFLQVSGYDGTTKIDLGNGYRVEVKNCLTGKEASLAEAAMIGNHRLGDGGQAAEINARGSCTETSACALSAPTRTGSGIRPAVSTRLPTPRRPDPPSPFGPDSSDSPGCYPSSVCG